jgi:ElaB/YqjD/DUF883 family membrane-anchored ribosome-binding protein
MNALPIDNDQVMAGNGKAAATDGRSTALHRRDGGAQEVHDLMADVQNLLGQMAHVADPEIARLRAKVADALDTAKRAVTDGTQRVQRQAKDAIRAGDGYVRNQPWQAVGVAAVAGLIVGILVARR